ncbi:hypothetical protein KHP62_15205 [Rhodobacteraceae bacterium NNCM2]|nr:hypothetical protein [Coraliihabitans acroporae]
MKKIAPLVAAALLAVAGPAQAQFFLKLTDGVGLTNDDYLAMKTSAETLYTDGEIIVGEVVAWSNPKSGAQGASEIVEFENNCVVLRHVLYVADRQKTYDFKETRCQSDDGRWLITTKE